MKTKEKRTHWWMVVEKKTGKASFFGPYDTRKIARTAKIAFLHPSDWKVIKVVEAGADTRATHTSVESHCYY